MANATAIAHVIYDIDILPNKMKNQMVSFLRVRSIWLCLAFVGFIITCMHLNMLFLLPSVGTFSNHLNAARLTITSSFSAITTPPQLTQQPPPKSGTANDMTDSTLPSHQTTPPPPPPETSRTASVSPPPSPQSTTSTPPSGPAPPSFPSYQHYFDSLSRDALQKIGLVRVPFV